MKKLFTILILTPIWLNAQDDNAVKWVNDLSWQQVQAKARSENKYIFLDLYATWCGPCKQMDKEVYTQASVANMLNEKFISVKVQTDKTPKDDEQVKSWYEAAEQLKSGYKVGGVPSYLFFDPNGNILHQDIGYRKTPEFLEMIDMVSDPRQAKMYPLYEVYKKGAYTRGYNDLIRLAIFTWKFINRDEAVAMAEDWKKNYLDNLVKDSAFTSWNLQCVCYFDMRLINVADRYFKFCYNYPQQFDSITNIPGKANEIVFNSIEKELNKKLQTKGVWKKYPNWKGLEHEIGRKYEKMKASLPQWMLDYKIEYYSSKYKDWRFWAEAKDEKIALYPPNPKTLDLSLELNDGGAWAAFLGTNDTIVLKKALRWIDLALTYKPNDPGFLDTKANVLYELGYKEDAIQLEEKALNEIMERINKGLDKAAADPYITTLDKMRKGLPTWSIKP